MPKFARFPPPPPTSRAIPLAAQIPPYKMLRFAVLAASLFLAAAEEDGHDHDHGGELCGCAQYEEDHPFKIDCTDKKAIEDAVNRLKLITPSKAACEAVTDGVMKTQVDFFILQAHHDYCDHDVLPTDSEKYFHDWEEYCLNCVISRNYEATLKACPQINCKDQSIIDAAHYVLETTCEAASGGHAHRRLSVIKAAQERRLSGEGEPNIVEGTNVEWEGSFATPGDEVVFRLQKVTGVTDCAAADDLCYPDAAIDVVVLSITEEDAKTRSGLAKYHAAAAAAWGNEVDGVDCTAVADGGTVTVGGGCHTLTLNQAAAESKYTINTAGVGHIILFAQHVPIEFERDAHYLIDAADADVEPIDQKPDPDGRCCDSLEGATQQGAAAGAFKSIVAYHDLCEHDDLPDYVEKDFHDYEARCENYFCNAIPEGYDGALCPSPPSPPYVAPSMPPIAVGIETGAVIGIIVAAVVVLAGLSICIILMYCKEKAGKPMFTNLDTKTTPGV